MKFSITSLLVSALAVGLAQAACQERSSPCSPAEVCDALVGSPGDTRSQVCGSTESSSGCTNSGTAVTCQCCT